MNEAAIIAVITLGFVVIAELAVIAFLVRLQHTDSGRLEIIDMADRMARRIQAPQLAAIQTANEEHSPLYAPPALIPDDDEAYWESREQLAERMMAEETGGGDH